MGILIPIESNQRQFVTEIATGIACLDEVKVEIFKL